MTAPVAGALSSGRPFPGLRPFDYPDHDYFFGRREQIFSLYRLLNSSRFVAVVGNSGSGKSSLVRAGLLPLLEEESRDTGGRTWLSIKMHPGDAPLRALTEVLAGLSKNDDPDIAAARRERIGFELKRSSFGVAEALRHIEHLEKLSLLLVVDQFEELFRYASSGVSQKPDLRKEAQSREEAAKFVQLLLEASRTQAHNVHVLLTMRSDFIGDCARFQGLPEAVSAVQFLVPALTRDQREEVIREPIKRAGAAIDPVLVERLLNDSSDELDQLPVLQHCLRRLWERAGAVGKNDVGREDSSVEKVTSDGNAPSLPSRSLTLDHYEAIGRMSGALSQHADEILSNLAGLKVVVEQTFRALSELDKEGRAVRRALPFERLRAETGASEPDLRNVLDRFRADDCAFLIPAPAAVATVADHTRIDVGHESLLRRWEKVNGEPGATGERGDPRRVGWLREEDKDGRRYKALLSMLENEGSGSVTLPWNQARDYWTWWKSRPRTESWGQRYGGGFERVQKLLQDSREKKRHDVLAIGALAIVVAMFVLGEGGMLYKKRLEQQATAAKADANLALALNSANQFLKNVLASLNAGNILVAGAKELSKTVAKIINDEDDTVNKTGNVELTPRTKALRVELLLTDSDISVSSGDITRAVQFAKDAQAAAQQLAAADPVNADWQILLYESDFRIGDGAAEQGDWKTALQRYGSAQAIVQKLVAMPSNDPAVQLKLAFVDNKVGETLQAQGNLSDALAQFYAALKIANSLAARDASNVDWQLAVAATETKIGLALAQRYPDPDYTGALQRFDAAIAIQTQLSQKAPDNDVVQSNLATSHRGQADVLFRQGDIDKALVEYEKAIKIRQALLDKDSANAVQMEYIAPDYDHYGDALKKAGNAPTALAQYQKEITVRQQLVNRDPNRTDRTKKLADTHTKIDALQPARPASSEVSP
jgi:tetratricopeptide (TPR) repeat protein/energy-coupling factor transporter ATP-binding protein EcfA2